MNVEKIDLPASSYRLDFYLWFRFDPSEISLNEVKEFEFVNGFSTKYKVDVDPVNGYLSGLLDLVDRMMLSVYTIFLYLSASVYVMKLVGVQKTEENKKIQQ